MRKWLLAVSSLLLALSFTGCAHQAGGYAYGGGYLDECEYWTDCYGGQQYACVFYQPVPAPARMEINLALHSHHSTRVVNPRDGVNAAPQDYGPSSGSAPAPATVTISREPVVVASPSVDRGSPRVHN